MAKTADAKARKNTSWTYAEHVGKGLPHFGHLADGSPAWQGDIAPFRNRHVQFVQPLHAQDASKTQYQALLGPDRVKRRALYPWITFPVPRTFT